MKKYLLAIALLMPLIVRAYDFSAVFHHLDAGSYYAYAFAVNYVDVSYGDTVRFTVP